MWRGSGLRGVLVRAGADGGLELAAKSDALVVRTTSDAASGAGGHLAASEAVVTRLRLGLEGTWHGIKAGGGALVPVLELGLRHDGDDAETGFGHRCGTLLDRPVARDRGGSAGARAADP